MIWPVLDAAVVQMLMHYRFWRKNHELEEGDREMLNFWNKAASQVPSTTSSAMSSMISELHMCTREYN